MKSALRYILAAALLLGLVAFNGCAAIREQGRLALEQAQVAAGGRPPGGGQPDEDEYYWWEAPSDAAYEGPLGHLRGHLQGNLYGNDFADIYFAPPAGWTLELAEHDAFERDGVDLVSNAPEGVHSSVTIMFRHVDAALSEDEYWAQRLSELQARGFGGGSFEIGALGFSPHSFRIATLSLPDGLRRYYMLRIEDYTMTIILQAELLADLDELTICFA